MVLKERGGAATAAEVASLAAEARGLAMESEATGLEQQLRRRQLELQGALEHAAVRDSAERFVRLLRRAGQLGMPPAMLQVGPGRRGSEVGYW